MSYLLTEVAMEMLGWRFYDDDGVPRPINFEGPNNVVCDGVENLAVSLAEQFPNLRLNIPATSTSASASASAQKDCRTPASLMQTSIIIDLDEDDDLPLSSDHESTNANVAGADVTVVNPSANVDPLENNNCNIRNSPLKPFDLRIENVRGGYDVSCEEKAKITKNIDEKTSPLAIVRVTSAGVVVADVETNREVTPVKQRGIDFGQTMEQDVENSNVTNTASSNCQQNIADFIDLTDDDGLTTAIGKQLDSEINKISSDLKRPKMGFHEIKPDSPKHTTTPSIFDGVLKSYHEQKHKNLQAELGNLQSFFQVAETTPYVHYEQTYPKYMDIPDKSSKPAQKSIDSHYKDDDDHDNLPSTSAVMKRKQVARKKTYLIN